LLKFIYLDSLSLKYCLNPIHYPFQTLFFVEHIQAYTRPNQANQQSQRDRKISVPAKSPNSAVAFVPIVAQQFAYACAYYRDDNGQESE